MNEKFKELIPKAIAGNKNAYEELYHLTKKPAYFIALSITGNEQDAMDILQDSYIKAFNSLSSVHIPEQFDGWVCRIVSNESKNYIKKKKPLLFSELNENFDEIFNEEETDASLIPHEAAEHAETNRLIMEIINKLNEDKRLVILMYYYQGMKTAEIAETLAIPLTTVNYKLLAAKKEIKAEMEKLEKNGTKLYSVPLFFILPDIFKNIAETNKTPAYNTLGLAELPAKEIPLSSGQKSKSPYANSGTGSTKFLSTLAGKITIGITSLAVISAVVVTIAVIGKNDKKKSPNPTVYEIPTTIATIPYDMLSETNSSIEDIQEAEEMTTAPPETEVAFEDMPLYEQLFVRGNQTVPNKAKITYYYSKGDIVGDDIIFTVNYELNHISDSYVPNMYDSKSIIRNITVESYSKIQNIDKVADKENARLALTQVLTEIFDGVTITTDDTTVPYTMTIENEKNHKTATVEGAFEVEQELFSWSRELYTDETSLSVMNDMNASFETAVKLIISQLEDPFGKAYSQIQSDFIKLYDYDIVQSDSQTETYMGKFSHDENLAWEITLSKIAENHYSYSIKRINEEDPDDPFYNSYVSYDIEWIE